MKRIITALCGLCTVVGLLIALPIPALADDTYDPKADWITYVMTIDETDKSTLRELTPPPSAFTDGGYAVTSTEGVKTYTMGNTLPISPSDGVYFELEVPRASMNGILHLCIWNTDRMVPGYMQLGSGVCSMLSPLDDDRLALMNALVTAADGDTPESGKALAPMIIDSGLGDEDTLVIKLEIAGGKLYINGNIIKGYADAFSFLKSVGENGLYISATMLADDDCDAAPMTVTRFGQNRKRSYVPGTTPLPIETGGAETDSEPHSGTVSDRPEDGRPEDSRPNDSHPDDDNPGGDPGGESVNDPHFVTKDPSGGTTTEPNSSKPEAKTTEEYTEPVTTSLMEYYASLYEKAGGCSSAVGATTLVSLAALAAAAYVLREKSKE